MLPTFFKRVLLTSLIIFAVPLLSQTVHALQIPENVEAVSPPKLDGLKKRVQNNSDSVTQEFEELDRFFAANPNHEQHSRYLNIKAYALILQQENLKSYEVLLKARELANSSNNTLALAESYRLEGMILDFAGEHASALEALNNALNLYTSSNSDLVLLVYSAMGNVYMSLKDYEQMLLLSKQYLSSAQRLKSKKDEGIAYFFQGFAQIKRATYQDATVSLLLSENILKSLNYPFIGIVHNAIADLHLAQGNFNEALKRLNMATEADRKVGFKYNQGGQLLKLVEIYKQRGNTALAISELKAGLLLDEIQQDKLLLLQLLDELVALSEQTQNYEDALTYSKQYQKAFEQSFNEQQSRLLALNRVRLSVSEKEETIKLLEKDNELKEQRNRIQKKQNTMQLYFISVVIAFLFLVVGLLIRTHRQHQALNALTQDLQKATAAKSDFLARMSHEIRTPLNAVIGLTKLSKRDAENTEQRTNLEQIESASQSLLSIINDILDFSKIEANKLTIECAPFNLEELVNKTVHLFGAKANEKHIETVVHISKNVPVNVKGDSLRIQQVLSNLISNAIKFTEDGLISVSIKCKEDSDNVVLQFEVKDTGIGLSSSQIAELFQPFNQGDESISRKYGGTGLGLAICQQLATLMGGRVWAESELGKGASFFFTVEVKRDSAPYNSSFTNATHIPNFSRKNILLAEDNTLNQKVALGLLNDTHATIKVVSNGREALEVLRKNSAFDIVLMDIQMPIMDGLAATKAIRNELALNIPIIAMTAHAMQQDIKKSLAAGMNGHISKPIDPAYFFNTLSSMLDDNTDSNEAAVTINSTSQHADNGSTNLLAADENALSIIDKAQAMKPLLDDEALYRSLLHDFVALEHELNELKNAIDANDIATILRILHIYTTSLRYIGAFALANYVTRLEKTIKHQDYSSLHNQDSIVEALFLLHDKLALTHQKVAGIVAGHEGQVKGK